jgi:hypothetical protein
VKIYAIKTSALYLKAKKLYLAEILKKERQKAMLTDILCNSCIHSVFDEKWGEWKCKKRCVRIYDISTANFCKYYIEKKKENKK